MSDKYSLPLGEIDQLNNWCEEFDCEPTFQANPDRYILTAYDTDSVGAYGLCGKTAVLVGRIEWHNPDKEYVVKQSEKLGDCLVGVYDEFYDAQKAFHNTLEEYRTGGESRDNQ